jgi:hypothetical protein
MSGEREGAVLSVAGSDSQPNGDPPQPCVASPHDVALVRSRPENVGVDEPDATTAEATVVDKSKNLVMLGLISLRQGMKKFEDCVPTCEGAAGEFSDHERMAHHLARLQEHGQLAVAAAKVVDPD